MPACYTDRQSVRPSERFTLHVSAKGPCRLVIDRVGAARRRVFTLEGLATDERPVPAGADRDGCGWPATLEIEAGADWQSGYYDIVLGDAGGAEAHHIS